MVRFEGCALQELVAEAIVEGAVEARSTAVCLQNLEALHLVLSVHKQLRLVAVDTHQNHLLHDTSHIAANKLVGDAIGEELQERKGRKKVEEETVQNHLITWMSISQANLSKISPHPNKGRVHT